MISLGMIVLETNNRVMQQNSKKQISEQKYVEKMEPGHPNPNPNLKDHPLFHRLLTP